MHFNLSNHWMPAIHISKRSPHLPLLSFVGLMLFQSEIKSSNMFSISSKGLKRLVSSLVMQIINVSVFLDCRTLTDTAVFKFGFFLFFLICTCCQKKDWNPLIGFLFQQYVYEFVWVHCFSLIPHTVPGEHFHFYQVCFVCVCSAVAYFTIL